jgi:hypothetical protein
MVYGTVASMDVDISDSQTELFTWLKPHLLSNIPTPPQVQSSAGLALPNLVKPSWANNILTDIHIHNLQQYAMEDHLQLQATQGIPENMFDIPIACDAGHWEW